MVARALSHDPTLDRLVEKQMRNWELARSQRYSSPGPKRREVEDFLCVSRQVGVEDRQVAAALAERLGWPLFDREILEAMAGDDEMRQRIYASMDERDLSWWEETLRSLMHQEFLRNDYFHRLCETLLSLACQGSCVFLGRGADLILPHNRGFRVRLVAPLEERIQTLAKGRGLSPEAARREIERLEQQRSAFFRHHFGCDADDPLRHDLVINLDSFSIPRVVDLILEARELYFRQR